MRNVKCSCFRPPNRQGTPWLLAAQNSSRRMDLNTAFASNTAHVSYAASVLTVCAIFSTKIRLCGIIYDL
jgi:hypothetical protein